MFDIEEELKKLPAKPGVYLMHDEKDHIIYVGKAISLKNRVRQYFQTSRNKGAKIEQMVTHIRRFEYIVTDSELEALVLECNLISYGGSSVLSTLIMFAIIQGLYILREDEEEDIERRKEQQLRAQKNQTRRQETTGRRKSPQDTQRTTIKRRSPAGEKKNEREKDAARRPQRREKTNKEKEINKQRIR